MNMTQLIASWRKAWGQDFPFLVMQLVNFGQGPGKPQTAFPELRQAQQQIADTVPNSGIAIGIDIGVACGAVPQKQKVNGIGTVNKASRDDRLARG
jgi:sialate O-acetylesterase